MSCSVRRHLETVAWVGWGSFQKEKGVSAVVFAAPSISIIISIARRGRVIVERSYKTAPSRV